MLTQVLDWVSNVGLVFLVLAIVVWAFNHRKMPAVIRFIGLYLIANLIIQLLADFLWQRSLNNLYLLHLNTLLEFVLLSLFFKEIYISQNFFKKNIYFIISGVAFLLVLNSLFWEPLDDYNSNAKSLVQVILITYVILYFFDAYGRVDLAKREDQTISIICFAILMYYAGSLSTFMFTQAISDDMKEGIRPIWIINGFLTAIFQLILLIAIARLAFVPKKSHN